MLKSSISIYNSLLFKSGSDYIDKHFLVISQETSHCDGITDIKAFMVARKLCFQCLKSLTNAKAYARGWLVVTS
jgi:hypothetical protein